MIIEQTDREVFFFKFQKVKASDTFKFLLLSDVHIDSLKCDRKLLKKHLDEALKINASVLIFGDLFDLMQGRYDPRKHKQAYNPKYLTGKYFEMDYLDAVVHEAIEFFSPYAKIIKFISYGNHESNIAKRTEHDPLERFIYGMNTTNGVKIHKGRYKGYIIFHYSRGNKGGVEKRIMHFHHGAGGAQRSKGVLNNDIDAKKWPSADIYVKGHDHQKWLAHDVSEHINSSGKLSHRRKIFLRLGCYKKSTDSDGWAVEKDFQPTDLGGWWMEQKMTSSGSNHRSIEVTCYEAQ